MGDNDAVSDDRVSVSPFTIDLDADSAAEPRNVPAVDADHSEMCEIVSEPDAHDAHDGAVPDCACEPADALARVDWTRVVFADAAVAPDAPGSPVCSFTYTVPSWPSSIALAVVDERPTVMGTPQR
jgi:hypothetical protein